MRGLGAGIERAAAGLWDLAARPEIVVIAIVCVLLLGASAAPATEPTPAPDPAVKKAEAPGIKNYSLLEGTRGYGGARFGFGGATDPSAMAFLKKQGFASVINLRVGTEEGADVEAGRAGARQAGLAYFHIPFDPAQPDAVVVEKFLSVLGDPANQPMFIHCKSGNRVGSLWMIKRVLKDGWTIDKAREEAVAIGLSTPAAEKFALDTIAAQRR